MKKTFFLIMAVIFTAAFYAAKAGDTTNVKKVVVTYLEKNLKIEGKEIMMHYYDEASLAYVILKEKTNSAGEVTFSVPGRTDGASYIFTFKFTEGAVKQGFAMRIPPSSLYGGQDSLAIVLSKEKKYYIKNADAPIQWMNFPDVGSPIGDTKTDINILTYNWTTQEASNIKRMGFENGGMKLIGVEDIFMEDSLINIIIK